MVGYADEAKAGSRGAAMKTGKITRAVILLGTLAAAGCKGSGTKL